MSLGETTRAVWGATVAAEHVATTERKRQEERGDDNGLVDICQTLHIPLRRIRKTQRVSAGSV